MFSRFWRNTESEENISIKGKLYYVMTSMDSRHHLPRTLFAYCVWRKWLWLKLCDRNRILRWWYISCMCSSGENIGSLWRRSYVTWPSTWKLIGCQIVNKHLLYVTHSHSMDGRAEAAILAEFGKARWFRQWMGIHVLGLSVSQRRSAGTNNNNNLWQQSAHTVKETKSLL